MATTKSLLTSGFTNTNSITIVHGLDTLNLNYRVVCSGISRSDLVQSTSFVDGNERNAFTVNLVSNETGFVQVLTSDIYSINLPSPENNVKLDGLPQASGITDTFVSGGTFNTTTDNIDFVGNSPETTFSVDMGIIQHDRQVADIPTWSPTGPATYTDIPGASATTGNLGTNGDYIIIFNANWQITNKNKQADFQILVGGSVQAISERGHSNAKQNEDYTISSSIMVSDIPSGTIIKVQGKVDINNLSIQRGTLIIDGIRTTNNIS